MSQDRLVLGLDFGGTKLAAGLVQAQRGELVAARRRLTPAAAGAQATLAAMLAMARELIESVPGAVTGAGINFGGPVDAIAGVVLHSYHVSGWDGVQLAAIVAEALGLPVSLENDANAQALAEWRFGAGRGSRAMAYLNVGTGIGGGLVFDGRLWRGVHGLAGEFGHVIIRPGGPLCTCGRYGCLEALASGPAMGRRVRELLAALPSDELPHNVMIRRAGALASVTGRELTSAAADGDPLALRVLDDIFADLAQGLATVWNSVDPDRLVLGGGAAEMAPSLFARLLARVRQACLAGTEALVDLRPAELGVNAGIFGGAAVFLGQ